MNPLAKRDFYAMQGRSYTQGDAETELRYELISPWFRATPKVTVREIGCKFAVLRDKLKNIGVEDYGALEIDADTIAKIGSTTPEQIKLHDANVGLPYEDASVDFLVALEVLEHLENPSLFFREAHRVLRPSGRLILSVPNPYCWLELVSNSRLAADMEGHISSFTFQNIDALLRFSGLRMLERRGTYTRLPFGKRLTGRDLLMRTESMWLTRSYLYLIGA